MIEDQDPIAPDGPEPDVVPVTPRRTADGASMALTRSTGLRIGIVIVLLLALAVPIVAAAVSGNPTPILAAGASAVPGASAKPEKPDKPGNEHGNGLGRALAPGLKGKAGRGLGQGAITITAINGSEVSLKTDDGWTRTITVTSDTVITKGGQTITLAGLAVGDEIRFAQTRRDDGTYAIDAIVVPTPRTAGVVTAVGADSITIQKWGGASQVIKVNSSTVYRLGPTPGSKADVKVGGEIAAQGTVAGSDFTALSVTIELPHAGGVVTAVDDSSITVKRRNGTTSVIHVSGSTTFKVKGVASATLADIAVGDRVEAAGTLRADGSLDAVAVRAGDPKGAKSRGEPDQDEAPAVSPAPS
jgi:hypothetical protein